MQEPEPGFQTGTQAGPQDNIPTPQVCAMLNHPSYYSNVIDLLTYDNKCDVVVLVVVYSSNKKIEQNTLLLKFYMTAFVQKNTKHVIIKFVLERR